ncbi:MAG TPA: hypothetical protein VE398_04635 [Acidobacteriota bacterium]|nr:hypothetical protein [Acidobacteriota bacterium]
MRSKYALLFVFLLAAALLMLNAPAAIAQNNCQAFRAIAVGQAPSPYQDLNQPLLDIWGGEVYASLGSHGAKNITDGIPNSIPLIGVFSGADADDYATDSRERKFGSGMGLHGAYTFAFGEPNNDWRTYTDKFTLTLGRAIWNITPGLWVGDYQASGHISGGSGMFKTATGNFTIHGPFFFFGDTGRWIPEVEGTICGVK